MIRSRHWNDAITDVISTKTLVGFNSGNVIFQKVCQEFAPSSFAASYSCKVYLLLLIEKNNNITQIDPYQNNCNANHCLRSRSQKLFSFQSKGLQKYIDKSTSVHIKKHPQTACNYRCDRIWKQKSCFYKSGSFSFLT